MGWMEWDGIGLRPRFLVSDFAENWGQTPQNWGRQTGDRPRILDRQRSPVISAKIGGDRPSFRPMNSDNSVRNYEELGSAYACLRSWVWLRMKSGGGDFHE